VPHKRSIGGDQHEVHVEIPLNTRLDRGRLMAKKKDAPLDLRTYLAKARGGTSKDYRKKSTVFSQGSPADSVFTLRRAR
jgi:hypothetical protein